MNQTEVFLRTEANNWFDRNKNSTCYPDKDKIFQCVKRYYDSLAGVKILEIGCGAGNRLYLLKQMGACVVGVEPSHKAVMHGRSQYGLSSDELLVGDALSYLLECKSDFDVVIFGFCLYLIPPEQLPDIVSGAVNSIVEGGYIVIFDFDSSPQSQPYHHYAGLISYKSRCDQYFSWLPYMHLVEKHVIEHDGTESMGRVKEDCALSVLRKVPIDHAYPEMAGSIQVKK